MSESEQETRKLYIAVHANPNLHMLPELFKNTEQVALHYAVLSGFLRFRELLLEHSAGCAAMCRLISPFATAGAMCSFYE